VAGTYTVVLWRSYDNVPIEKFDNLISFLIDYALKVSEAYIPVQIRTSRSFPVAIKTR